MSEHIEARQMTFYELHSQMHFIEWKCLNFQSTKNQHWLRWWLGAEQATSHYLSQWWPIHWRIYASPGLGGLTRLKCTLELGHDWFRMIYHIRRYSNQRWLITSKTPWNKFNSNSVRFQMYSMKSWSFGAPNLLGLIQSGIHKPHTNDWHLRRHILLHIFQKRSSLRWVSCYTHTVMTLTLQWRHEYRGVSNHRQTGRLLN